MNGYDFVKVLEGAFGKYQSQIMAEYIAKAFNDRNQGFLQILIDEIMNTYAGRFGNPPTLADINSLVYEAKKRYKETEKILPYNLEITDSEREQNIKLLRDIKKMFGKE